MVSLSDLGSTCGLRLNEFSYIFFTLPQGIVHDVNSTVRPANGFKFGGYHQYSLCT